MGKLQTRKKVVISGSSKLQDKVNYWVKYFKNKNFDVLDYPKFIEEKDYNIQLAMRYKEFYTSINNTNVFFLMNDEKNRITGYIGAGSFAELTYAVVQNILYNKNIDIYILNIPDREVQSYDEVKFWLDMGWIKVYEK